jgi:hypothetical protein
MADGDRKAPPPRPGVSRADRLSDAGLERLRRQLTHGARPSEAVLRQWILRYGDEARRLIDAHAASVPGRPDRDDRD